MNRSISRLIADLRLVGISVSAHGSDIRCRTQGAGGECPDLAELKARKSEAVEFLRGKRSPKPLPPVVTSKGRPASFPLSLSQRALLETADPIHAMERRVPMTRRLRGPLDVAKMEQALYRLTAAHEILRTRYAKKDGVFCQEILRPDPIQLVVEDLTAVAPAMRERRVWALLHERYKTEVRPDRPAVDLRVFRIDKDDHYLAGFLSHFAFDAASTATFWRTLFEYYRSEILGVPADTHAPPIQYADFALWEKGLLTPEQWAISDSIWNDRLGLAQPLRLPNAPEPMTKPSPWGAVEYALRDTEFGTAARSAGQMGVTVPILFLGALAAVLSRWTGQDRPVLGKLINGRPPGLTDTIGCFAQLRPFCLDLAADPTFEELMALSRRGYIDASDLRMPPPAHIMERLQPGRFLVNVASSDEGREDDLHEELGLTVTARNLPKPLKTEVSRDLEFRLTYDARSLDGWIVYATDRFKWNEVQELAREVTSLITRGIESPGARISALLPRGTPAMSASAGGSSPH